MAFIEVTLSEASAVPDEQGRVPGRAFIIAAGIATANDMIDRGTGQRVNAIVRTTSGQVFAVAESAAEIVSRVEMVEDEQRAVQRTTAKAMGDMVDEMKRHD